ncbi:MAG: hypothetical protein U0R24_02965 [Solirubrobacterales bacterium]
MKSAGARSLPVVLAALATSASLLAAAAPAHAVRAGVSVDPRSGAITIRPDEPGGPVLRESTRRGSGPGGRVGFLDDGRWYHARSLVKVKEADGRRTYVLETGDPSKRRILLGVEGLDDGITGISASLNEGSADAIGIGFDAPKRERMLGFG